MIGPSVKVTVTGKGLSAVQRALAALADKQLLVGIPEETGPRDGAEVTNAQLAYIHTYGSPLKNIPARPFLEPAIEDPENRRILAAGLRAAAEAALEGNAAKAIAILKETGQDAEDFVRAWFTSPKNGWPPLAPSTIEARARRKYKISRYKREATRQKYRQKLAEYIATGTFNPLIDEGGLYRAIIWILAERGEREIVRSIDVTGGEP